MKMVLTCVFDSAVGAYNAPIAFKTVNEAKRTFIEACSDEGHQFSKHAKDYALCVVGTFDSDSGMVNPSTAVETLITALQACSIAKEAQALAEQMHRRHKEEQQQDLYEQAEKAAKSEHM